MPPIPEGHLTAGNLGLFQALATNLPKSRNVCDHITRPEIETKGERQRLKKKQVAEFYIFGRYFC